MASASPGPTTDVASIGLHAWPSSRADREAIVDAIITAGVMRDGQHHLWHACPSPDLMQRVIEAVDDGRVVVQMEHAAVYNSLHPEQMRHADASVCAWSLRHGHPFRHRAAIHRLIDLGAWSCIDLATARPFRNRNERLLMGMMHAAITHPHPWNTERARVVYDLIMKAGQWGAGRVNDQWKWPETWKNALRDGWPWIDGQRTERGHRMIAILASLRDTAIRSDGLEPYNAPDFAMRWSAMAIDHDDRRIMDDLMKHIRDIDRFAKQPHVGHVTVTSVLHPFITNMCTGMVAATAHMSTERRTAFGMMMRDQSWSSEIPMPGWCAGIIGSLIPGPNLGIAHRNPPCVHNENTYDINRILHPVLTPRCASMPIRDLAWYAQHVPDLLPVSMIMRDAAWTWTDEQVSEWMSIIPEPMRHDTVHTISQRDPMWSRVIQVMDSPPVTHDVLLDISQHEETRYPLTIMQWTMTDIMPRREEDALRIIQGLQNRERCLP